MCEAEISMPPYNTEFSRGNYRMLHSIGHWLYGHLKFIVTYIDLF